MSHLLCLNFGSKPIFLWNFCFWKFFLRLYLFLYNLFSFCVCEILCVSHICVSKGFDWITYFVIVAYRYLFNILFMSSWGFFGKKSNLQWHFVFNLSSCHRCGITIKLLHLTSLCTELGLCWDLIYMQCLCSIKKALIIRESQWASCTFYKTWHKAI